MKYYVRGFKRASKLVLEWLISELQKKGIANISELLNVLDDIANGKLIYRAEIFEAGSGFIPTTGFIPRRLKSR